MQSFNMKTVAIITAGGMGKRMGQPKQFLEIAGKPMVEQTISIFEKADCIDEIILVISPEEIEKAKKFKFKKIKKIVAGGKERQDSVNNGLKELPDDCEIVAIHDGARPFVSVDIIEESVREAKKEGAIVVGVPVKDTIKQLQTSNIKHQNKSELQIEKTLNRKSLWRAQTPQVFKKEIIVKAYQAGYNRYQVTDDAMLVEKLGIPVKMAMGSYQNIKITTPEDLKLAKGIIS